MRIPSQFNDSSLYRPRRGEDKGPKRSQLTGQWGARRRLIRLAVALLLVIVVMREARQPGFYETFFASDQDGWVSTDPSGKHNPTPISTVVAVNSQSERDSEPSRDSGDGSPTPGNQPKWSMAPQWVDSMELPTQRAWIQTLIALKSPSVQPPAKWMGLSSEQIVASEETLILLVDGSASESESEELANVLRGIEKVRDFAQGNEFTPDFWKKIDWWAIPMLAALDQSALGRVTDGTFWSGTDSDAFYLQLAQADELTADGAATTGTLPLLQQPDVYRGQRVRIVGTLQLAERLDAKPNRVGIKNYWKLWIIPADGGIRPTILMTPQLPQSLAGSLTDDGKWDKTANPGNPTGQFAAVGRFIKRLPYRSSVGADLAPVVIGRVIATLGDSVGATAPVSMQTDTPKQAASSDHGRMRSWGMLLAVFTGIALAGGLMYRTSIDAKRSRLMRKQATDGTTLNLDGLSGKTDQNSESDGDGS